MNILHTETLKKWGGQQNRVLSEAIGLAKRGHSVSIACNTGSVLAQKAGERGIKVYELYINKKTYHKTIPALMGIIRKENIDIVSTHSSTDSWAGGIAAKLAGRKLVRFRHNLYKIGRDPLTRLIYKMPDKIIAISESIKDALVQRGLKSSTIEIIHSSVDMDLFNLRTKDLRKELDIPTDAVVIGNTSTFTELKGQEFLLSAFNRICEKIPCLLLLAGRLIEPSKSRYLSYVKKELRDKVILLGHRDDVQMVLKTIDIFVYPSFMEGLGTALLEAMAMGKPVVVSDIPTFRNFIVDGTNGIFFKAGDPEDIAEKVSSLIKDKNLREALGKQAMSTAMEKFTLDKMIDNTEALYAGVLNG